MISFDNLSPFKQSQSSWFYLEKVSKFHLHFDSCIPGLTLVSLNEQNFDLKKLKIIVSSYIFPLNIKIKRPHVRKMTSYPCELKPKLKKTGVFIKPLSLYSIFNPFLPQQDVNYSYSYNSWTVVWCVLLRGIKGGLYSPVMFTIITNINL